MSAIRSFIEWYMLISLPVQTATSLDHADTYLAEFDKQKNVFTKAGCSLGFPKLHSLQHYSERVRMFGTPDNFDTEYMEHQHISDAKDAYKRTNKVNHVQQMVQYVERRSALEMKCQFLDTFKNSSSSAPTFQNSVGSRVPGSMKIAAIEEKYG